MNRKTFFDAIRKSLFGGKLTQEQVDGITRILDYHAEHWPKMPLEELAYVLATVKWETGHSFQPIREVGGPGKRYAPYYGRGLVQLTWEANYERYGIKDTPDKALEWPTSLHVLFDGMVKGVFTGQKLADYISPTSQDYEGARSIVNGTDQKTTIAGYARKFLAALREAGGVQPAPSGIPGALEQGSITVASAGAGATGVGAAAGVDAHVLAALIGCFVLAALVLFALSRIRRPQRPVSADRPPMPEPKGPATKLDAADTALAAVIRAQTDLTASKEALKKAQDTLAAARADMAGQIAALQAAYAASEQNEGKGPEG